MLFLHKMSGNVKILPKRSYQKVFHITCIENRDNVSGDKFCFDLNMSLQLKVDASVCAYSVIDEKV